MRTKLRLSHTEQREYTLYAKRLSAVGIIPSEEKPLREAQMLSLERTGGVLDNFVHVPPTGGYGIVVRVRIVALKSGINLSGCEIKPCKWHDADIELMEAPEDLDYYQVIGGFECPKEDVLNPWISSTRSLGFGQVLQGAIVARSFGSLPKWCDNGISIEADLCFFDQFENLCPLGLAGEVEHQDDVARGIGAKRGDPAFREHERVGERGEALTLRVGIDRQVGPRRARSGPVRTSLASVSA